MLAIVQIGFRQKIFVFFFANVALPLRSLRLKNGKKKRMEPQRAQNKRKGHKGQFHAVYGIRHLYTFRQVPALQCYPALSPRGQGVIVGYQNQHRLFSKFEQDIADVSGIFPIQVPRRFVR